MKKALIVTSVISEVDMTPAGVAYLATVLNEKEYDFDILNLSGSINYFSAPEELYGSCKSPEWLNPDSVRCASWMDAYFEEPKLDYDLVL